MLEEELFAARFKSLLTELRESAKKYPATMEEITKEVEAVRQRRYESRNGHQYMDQLPAWEPSAGHRGKKILSKEIKVVVSDEMLKELAEVSNRPKFKNIFTSQRMKELFSLLDGYAIIVSPGRKVNACRDEKDNFLLEVAFDGKADYLITGDEDLH